MTKLEASKLISDIANSIKDNPAQFHFAINVIGTRAVGTNGGIGLSVSVNGGHGNTGFVSRVDGNSVEIAKKAANEEISRTMNALYDLLVEIHTELATTNPDKNKLERFMDSLKADWIPGVITSVVGNVIYMALKSRL